MCFISASRWVPSTGSMISRWDIYSCRCGRGWMSCGPSWMKLLIMTRLGIFWMADLNPGVFFWYENEPWERHSVIVVHVVSWLRYVEICRDSGDILDHNMDSNLFTTSPKHRMMGIGLGELFFPTQGPESQKMDMSQCQSTVIQIGWETEMLMDVRID